jgi:hypothetical protein
MLLVVSVLLTCIMTIGAAFVPPDRARPRSQPHPPDPPRSGPLFSTINYGPSSGAGIVALHVTGQHSLGCRDRAVKECAASSLSSQCRRAQRYSVIAVARAAEGLGLRTKETTSAVLAAGRFAVAARDEEGKAKGQQHQRLFHGRPLSGQRLPHPAAQDKNSGRRLDAKAVVTATPAVKARARESATEIANSLMARVRHLPKAQ